MRRLLFVLPATFLAILVSTSPAYACGGLIGPNGAVNLVRTTTFAGYHDGVEHYVTSFSYAGAGGAFGAIVPLPGIPSDVSRGGDWTLQRLVKETTPAPKGAFLADTAQRSAAEVLLQTRIDALDITVLRGGGDEVGAWAKDHGFRLPPDAPEVLDFYANRSPIFLTAVFDGDAAAKRGQRLGDGTPVHITVPTANPWVPLRILGLGKLSGERVQADVFLLTDRRPVMLPGPSAALRLQNDAPATSTLLSDLRSDKGMSWVPPSGWLTKIQVDASAGELRYDLAVDASGTAAPSRTAAGLAPLTPPFHTDDLGLLWLIALAAAYAFFAAIVLRRPVSISR